jgi:calnexin
MRSRTLLGALALALVRAEDAPAADPVEVPATVDGAIFFEPFLSTWEDTWQVSKDADFSGKWRHEEYGTVAGEDKGLVVGNPAQKHAVSTLFSTPIDAKDKGLVIQYELQLKNTLQCGGAYIKLLTASDALSADGFVADTPYTIMFGPDKCGDTNKVHFILRHKNPVSGEWEEKHMVTPPVPDTLDKLTHLYTAVIGTDNTVKILVDNVEKKSANLLSDTDFSPPVNPPKEIDDPQDKKPEDWIDEPKMDEPGAAKPDDWDEEAPTQIPDPKVSKPSAWLDDAPSMVADPSAQVPSDWDADEDGEWEAPLVKNPDCAKYGCGEWKAPLIANPEYKGKWYAPKVDNPEYIGVWAPKKIANPSFFVDEAPHAVAPIGGLGIELWTMQDGILFDNILLTHDPAVASDLAKRTFVPRRALEDKKKRESQLDGELGDNGFVGKLRYYLKRAWFYTQDNLLLVGGSLCLGLIPLLLFCCCSGGGKKDDDDDDGAAGSAPTAAARAAASGSAAGASGDAEDDDDGEPRIVEEEKVEEEPKGKAKGGAKKRTPKAS